MCQTLKKIFPSVLYLLALSLFFSLYSCIPAWAQQTMPNIQEAETTAAAADQPEAVATKDSPETETPVAPKAVDLIGEEIGLQIDSLTKKASTRIGSWINVKVFAGITWLKLIIVLLLLFLVLLVERIVRIIINRRRRKIEEKETQTIQHLILDAAAKPVSMFIWVYGIYIVLTPLFSNFREPDGTNLVHAVAQKAADLGAAITIIWFIFKLVAIVDFHLKKWASSMDSGVEDVLAPLVGKTLRVFIIIIGGILILQNLTGVKIGPILASLGIGGVAVALAAKDSIANFFGTLTILFDKPFRIGERVVIDNYDGVIEDIGFRSTRIRTLNGHLVTIPNEKVVNSGLENIGKRPHIRWLTNITLTYDTPPDKVEQAVAMIREILDNHEGMHPDFPPRVYFNGFNDWSLNILVIVWYHPANYWDMQAWQQQTCLKILKRFNDEGIDFAFPSSTIYLANDDARQLKLKILEGETVTYIPEKEKS